MYFSPLLAFLPSVVSLGRYAPSMTHFHSSPTSIFIETPENEALIPYRNQLKKALNTRKVCLTTSREQANLIIIFLFGNDNSLNLTYLTRVMSLSHENRATLILAPDLPSGKSVEKDQLNFLRQVDGWIFGCRLPKKVPTPMIIGGDFSGILRNIETIIGSR